jgi:hypothetical protein
MKDNKKNIEKQWQASTVSWDGDTLILDDEFDWPKEIIVIDRFMHELVHTKEPLFDVENCEGKKGQLFRTTPLGARFWHCLGIDVWKITRVFHQHKLSPYFSLFARHVKQSGLAGIGLGIDTVQQYNEWGEKLRSEAKAEGFAKIIDNHERAMRKNVASLLEYLRGMHEAHAKLVVVRLELGYSKDFRNSSGSSGVNPIDVKRHMRALLKFLARRYPTLVGYVWKLEYGLLKSYHYHLMLFFNGHEVREDVTLGKLIGDHWSKVVTADTGTSWNCNAKKETYEKLGLLGIGTIHYSDVEGRENLERAALYLTKVDYYVRLNAPEVGRTFGKGSLRVTVSPRRGRPRKIPRGTLAVL